MLLLSTKSAMASETSDLQDCKDAFADRDLDAVLAFCARYFDRAPSAEMAYEAMLLSACAKDARANPGAVCRYAPDAFMVIDPESETQRRSEDGL